jgi:hypothetical protein
VEIARTYNVNNSTICSDLQTSGMVSTAPAAMAAKATKLAHSGSKLDAVSRASGGATIKVVQGQIP